MLVIRTFLLVSFLVGLNSRLIDLDNLYLETDLYTSLYNQTMEWGTYKPNQFFGLKNRNPTPLTVGLIWAVPDVVRQTMTVRHTYRY